MYLYYVPILLYLPNQNDIYYLIIVIFCLSNMEFLPVQTGKN